jgi:hypothetical protein
MPLEIEEWKDFKNLTDGSTTFVYKEEEGDGLTVATTQFFIKGASGDGVMAFLKQRKAVKVKGSLRWEEIFR